MEVSSDTMSDQSTFMTSSEGNSFSSPPPSFSRLPPDGHEFPPNYEEAKIEQSAIKVNESYKSPVEKLAFTTRRKLSSDDEVLVPKNETPSKNGSFTSTLTCSSWPKNEKNSSECRKTYLSETSIRPVLNSGRRKDERSAGSVKDKIAIFSSSSDSEPLFPQVLTPDTKLIKTFKSSEDVFRSSQSTALSRTKRLSKSFVSVDKITDGRNNFDFQRENRNSLTNGSGRLKSNKESSRDNEPDNGGQPTTATLPFPAKNVANQPPPNHNVSASAAPSVQATGDQYSTLPKKHRSSTDGCDASTTELPDCAPGSAGGSRRSQSVAGLAAPPGSSESHRASSANALRSDDGDYRRVTLNSLIEQRRRGMSKLRGLVIPEKTPKTSAPSSVIDLPEIKSKEPALLNKSNALVTSDLLQAASPSVHQRNSSTPSLSTPPWKSSSATSNLPKYSPAFKRKSLQLYTSNQSVAFDPCKTENDDNKTFLPPLSHIATEMYLSSKYDDENEEKNVSSLENDKLIKPHIRNINNNYSEDYKLCISESSKTLPLNDAPKSLESITSPAQSDCSFDYISNYPERRSTYISNDDGLKSNFLQMDSKSFYVGKTNTSTKHKNDLARSEDESDNDSAVSSSQSSYISRGCSPLPSSSQESSLHYRNIDTNMLISPSSSISSNDDATSDDKNRARKFYSSETNLPSHSAHDLAGQHLNDYDNVSPRVLKAQSVEAINRKNILASAKCRSGRDLKTGSPLIQRKFVENENNDSDIIRSNSGHDLLKTTEYLQTTEGNNNVFYEDSDRENVHRKTLSENSDRPLSADINTAFIENESDSSNNCIVETENDNSISSSNSSHSNDLSSQIIPHHKMTSSNSCSSSICYSNDNVAKNEETGEYIRKIELDNRKYLLSNKPHQLSSKTAKFYLHEYKNEIPVKKFADENNVCNGRDESTEIHKVSQNKLLNNIESRRANSAESFLLENTTALNVKANKDSNLPKRDANKRTSVTNIRKTFEKNAPAQFTVPVFNTRVASKPAPGNNHAKMSSVDSTASEPSNGIESLSTIKNGNDSTNTSINSDLDGVNSSTRSLSSQDILNLITEANQTIGDDGSICSINTNDVIVVILYRETAGGSVGITLTGGIDYEAKAITVHKVLNGSPAHKDGRLQKGDRILSINGRCMNGLTHRESIDILKAPRSEVTLIVWPCQKNEQKSVNTNKRRESNISTKSNSSPNNLPLTNPPNKSSASMKVMLVKDGAGLGFSLDGGYDSPLGDKPLIIKKIFTGGAAEKCGYLQAGDELLGVNDSDVVKMSRIEVWGLMKKLSEGNVTLTIRRNIL